MKVLRILCLGYLAYAFLKVDMLENTSYLTWLNNMKIGLSALAIIELVAFALDNYKLQRKEK